jgi:hypothetical protein
VPLTARKPWALAPERLLAGYGNSQFRHVCQRMSRVPHVSWFSRRGILTAPETNSETWGQKRGKRGDGNVARGQATDGTHPSLFRSTGLPTSQKIGERPVCPHISLRLARKLGSVRDLASVIQIQVNLSPALERTR